jgi:hypothetical protein
LPKKSTGFIVGIYLVHSQLTQRAVPLGEIPLRGDGLAFSLLFGADPQVDGYGHGDTIHCSGSAER